jgi:hypothetical protein
MGKGVFCGPFITLITLRFMDESVINASASLCLDIYTKVSVAAVPSAGRCALTMGWDGTYRSSPFQKKAVQAAAGFLPDY